MRVEERKIIKKKVDRYYIYQGMVKAMKKNK